MSVHERTYGRPPSEIPSDPAILSEPLFSADSHVIEPAKLWERELPEKFRDRAPGFGGRRQNDNPGAMEKAERVKEMTADGVIGEVLYPTHGLRLLSLEDPELEEACVRIYNDWLIDYCQAAPDRLVGLAMLSVYNIDHAIQEMERCRKAGLRGATIWQVPHPDLPFSSEHYESLWAASQEMEMPISLHILSGFGYSSPRGRESSGPQVRSGQQFSAVNLKLLQSVNALYDFIFSGVLERFPRFKLVMAENEIGWLPFVLEQWDYYSKRFPANGTDSPVLSRLPSEYFDQQVFVTFFNDAVGGRMLSWWGADNCMWSNDYPHGNATWPSSHEIVARDLGVLPAETRSKLVRENVARVYNIPVPAAAVLV